MGCLMDMENPSSHGQIFRWKRNNPKLNKHVNTIMRVSKDENKENIENPYFPPTYNEVKEGGNKLYESNPPKWMDM
jgi:hypothetical protein